MNALVACDSFKGSLDAASVCEAITAGLTKQGHKAIPFPMADGGEGTAQILAQILKGETVEIISVNPLGKKIKANYGWITQKNMAIMDMAACSGIELLSAKELNPMSASTFGTGLMIKHALKRKPDKIVIGIGGSATNDGGIGMAAALGFCFKNQNGEVLKPIPENLCRINSIEKPNIVFPKIEVLCDVTNPLTGTNGASAIYGPQKGATKSQIKILDDGLRQLASFFPDKISLTSGAGAAGGLGFGLMALLGAQLKPGIETIMQISKIEEQIKTTDLVITGEGKIDHQTTQGKLIGGICTLAKKYHKPVLGICGKLDANENEIKLIGLKDAFSIMTEGMDVEYAMKNTEALLTKWSSKQNFENLI